MYFKSREAAGKLLAAQVARKYKNERCAIIALNDGGVMVGIQIAKQLKTVIMMLLTEDVDLPREPEAIGGMTMDGSFGYNTAYSSGELDEMWSEYHNFIEAAKMRKLHVLNELSEQGLLMRRDLLDR